MIYHDYLFHSDNCNILKPSCINLANEVSKRHSKWIETWDKDYMKFAKGSLSTQLYETYNVFLCQMPGFAELYNLVIQYFKSKESNYYDYAMAGWVNVYNKDEFLDWHKHGPKVGNDGRWHGYVTINAEPSKTLYKNEKGLVETIENKNGYITLNPAGLIHRVTPWTNKDEPRITIAFDFLERHKIDPLNITRWIPVI